jgi:hypothetical protein
MENQREDLVVILAGYKDRMETFFQSNPGVSSRIAHHLDFPDYTLEELLAIAQLMLAEQRYRFSPDALQAFEAYLVRRMRMPRFSNARSVRNALDRARLRQANRLFAMGGENFKDGPDDTRSRGYPRQPGLQILGRVATRAAPTRHGVRPPPLGGAALVAARRALRTTRAPKHLPVEGHGRADGGGTWTGGHQGRPYYMLMCFAPVGPVKHGMGGMGRHLHLGWGNYSAIFFSA